MDKLIVSIITLIVVFVLIIVSIIYSNELPILKIQIPALIKLLMWLIEQIVAYYLHNQNRP